MKHTDIKVGEYVWVRAKKIQENANDSAFVVSTSIVSIGNAILWSALTEEDVNELHKQFTPEVGKEYEVSNDGVNWCKRKLRLFECDNNYAGDKVFIPDYFKFIRPIEETTTVVVKKSKEEAVKEFISSLK